MSKTILLGCFILLSSCSSPENKTSFANPRQVDVRELITPPVIREINHPVFYADTVTARTTQELVQQIRPNRLIRLIDHTYTLGTPLDSIGSKSGEFAYLGEHQGLVIDRIRNLKIVGTPGSKLVAYGQNATVLKFSNAINIHLDSLNMGYAVNPAFDSKQGVLRINNSNNINISNCKIVGSATIGLITYGVHNLRFFNSTITECTTLIFDIERSEKVEFKNTKFRNNTLFTSVMGGISNASKEVSFINCEFLNNQPAMAGNPAFNLIKQVEPVRFTNCTFKNNKGFKWYRGIIELDHCQVDSSDFIGF